MRKVTAIDMADPVVCERPKKYTEEKIKGRSGPSYPPSIIDSIQKSLILAAAQKK